MASTDVIDLTLDDDDNKSAIATLYSQSSRAEDDSSCSAYAYYNLLGLRRTREQIMASKEEWFKDPATHGKDQTESNKLLVKFLSEKAAGVLNGRSQVYEIKQPKAGTNIAKSMENWKKVADLMSRHSSSSSAIVALKFNGASHHMLCIKMGMIIDSLLDHPVSLAKFESYIEDMRALSDRVTQAIPYSIGVIS